MTKCIVEYFEDGTWIKSSSEKILRHKHFYHLLRRTTDFYENSPLRTEYFCGWRHHRLDGPSILQIESNEIVLEQWYVDGVILPLFLAQRHCNDIVSYLFEYILDFPEHMELVEKLARHNKWLDEEQLLLLKTMNAFTEKLDLFS